MGSCSLLINVLELFDMVWTTLVMIEIRKKMLRREGEATLMRGDNTSAV